MKFLLFFPYLDNILINDFLVQCCICPGVLPKSDKYLPLNIFKIRYRGSFGTEIRTYLFEILNNSLRAFWGYFKCSKTLLAMTKL